MCWPLKALFSFMGGHAKKEEKHAEGSIVLEGNKETSCGSCKCSLIKRERRQNYAI